MNESKLLRNMDEIRRKLRHMNLTMEPLAADVFFSTDEWQKDKGSQFWGRCVVRCMFAYLECLLWQLKNAAPHIADLAAFPLTDEDRLFAAEEKIDKQGRRVRSFAQFRPNVAGTFRLFGKACGLTVELQDCLGFQSLCKAYERRGHFMHPKRPFDLNVSPQELLDATTGMNWISEQYNKLFEECSAAVQKKFGAES